jgi:excisionase family DNA binding protein
LKESRRAAAPRLAYSPEETAELIGVSRACIYNWFADGSLPSAKLGGCRRVLAADLDAFLTRAKAAK